MSTYITCPTCKGYEPEIEDDNGRVHVCGECLGDGSIEVVAVKEDQP